MVQQRLSFKTLLLLGMGLLLLIPALNLLTLERRVVQLSDQFSGLVDLDFSVWNKTMDLLVLQLESARHTRNMLILDEAAVVDELRFLEERRVRRGALEGQIGEALVQRDQRLREAWADAEAAKRIYNEREDAYVAMVRDRRYAEAKKNLIDETRPAQLELIRRTYLFVDLLERSIAERRALGQEVLADAKRSQTVTLVLSTLIGLLIAWLLLRDMQRRLGGDPAQATQVADRIASGDLDVEVPVAANAPDSLMVSLRRMSDALKRSRQAAEEREWLKTGLGELADLLRLRLGSDELAVRILAYLAGRLGFAVGAWYEHESGSSMLQLRAGYALPAERALGESLALGEGLTGQAAQENRVLEHESLPADYLPVSSALGRSDSTHVLVLPLNDLQGLIGVLELGGFKPLTALEREFLHQARELIGQGMGAVLARSRTEALLERTQQQALALQAQHEELEQTNQELKAHGSQLEAQRALINERNEELQSSQAELERRAADLAQASQYKSEFLANMSHELRTPLNSMLMLSALLKENRSNNLDARQLKFVDTIHSAGNDLLTLINDILDLAKIESGQLEFQYASVPMRELLDPLRALFQQQASAKGVDLEVLADPGVPAHLLTDASRVRQVLKNLLSNALKFTERGRVDLHVQLAAHGTERLLEFEVRDTGIGIAADKHALVFEAFRQADGGVSRKYGGTGLGLSISRELARRLGGDLELKASVPGQGSCFSLLLPLQQQLPSLAEPSSEAQSASGASAGMSPAEAPRARAVRPVQVLVIEDDERMGELLCQQAKDRGLSVEWARDGAEGLALALAAPPQAVLLDVQLPTLNGWDLMRQLRADLRTHLVPVHFVTASDDEARAQELGAASFHRKPLTVEELAQLFDALALAPIRHHVLLLEDDPREAEALSQVLSSPQVQVSVLNEGQELLQRLRETRFDALVLDLGLGAISGLDLLEELDADPQLQSLPVMVHTGREVTPQQQRRLDMRGHTVVIKGALSHERLRMELALLLGAADTDAIEAPPQEVQQASPQSQDLQGLRVLVVDDDVRNVFTISSWLDIHGAEVLEAEHGAEALECLAKHPDIDIVLMDIMMPVMDGYAAIEQLRKDERWRQLPVIAMTAKAMKADRQRCLDAGASEYISKPIDGDKLLPMMLRCLAGRRAQP
ncbi:response regulator [Roseateles sp.]|jgi:CheY-like chemotaxis protein/HAMP domain-containing protein|uniref:response regulator n=1 Tax=Roseateles sp. TaxID=1971397 RepID=UPI0039194F88